MIQRWSALSAGTRLPPDRVRIVEANEPFAIRSMQRQRIFNPMRPFLAHGHTTNDEPNPMAGFRVDHQHLPVEIQQQIEAGPAARLMIIRN